MSGTALSPARAALEAISDSGKLTPQEAVNALLRELYQISLESGEFTMDAAMEPIRMAGFRDKSA